jgi:oligopeptide/dipeptide ABC transporter ATP-binding protein
VSTAEIETRPAPEHKPGGEPVLKLVNVKKYFPITRGILIQRRIGNVHAVDGIDIEVRTGETLGLVGETGCGKSTTARLINRLLDVTQPRGVERVGHARLWIGGVALFGGAIVTVLSLLLFSFRAALIFPLPMLVGAILFFSGLSARRSWRRRPPQPGEGQVIFEGRDITRLSRREMRPLRRDVQMIFQDPYASLNPRKTVGSIVGEPMHIHGIPGQGRFKPTFRTATKVLAVVLAALAFLVWLMGVATGLDVPGLLPLGLLVGAIVAYVLGRLVVRPARKNWNAEVKKEVQRLMELVGLNPEHYNRFPHEFSGGQRQRIGVARALALRPRLIVCDEPVSALDVSIQAQILNLLEDLQEEFNLTYVFIAHDLSVVKHMSDRVAVMYLGRIVEIAPGDTLYENPKHPYTGALLSAVPIPDPNLAASKRRIILEGDVPSPIDPPSGCRFHPRCPRAQFPICKENDPALTPHHRGQLAACHFPLEDRAVIQSTA